jgi:PAS domain S-box-containing protein
LKNLQLHEAVKNAKDFLENLIHSSPDAIITTDIHGIATSFSRGAENIFGYSEQEIIGQPFFKYLSPKDIKKDIWDKLMQFESISNYEVKFLSHSRKYIPISFSLSLLKDKYKNHIGMLAIGKDLTEIKKLESELLEKEKLSVLMETAVAINHEINNPLTPILGNIQLMLLHEPELPKWIIEKLHVIETNAWRIQKIIQKLNQITQPVKKKYYGNTHMLDIEHS